MARYLAAVPMLIIRPPAPGWGFTKRADDMPSYQRLISAMEQPSGRSLQVALLFGDRQSSARYYFGARRADTALHDSAKIVARDGSTREIADLGNRQKVCRRRRKPMPTVGAKRCR